MLFSDTALSANGDEGAGGDPALGGDLAPLLGLWCRAMGELRSNTGEDEKEDDGEERFEAVAADAPGPIDAHNVGGMDSTLMKCMRESLPPVYDARSCV